MDELYKLEKLINLLLSFGLCCVFAAEHGLSLVVARGGHSSLWCLGFSLLWLLLLRAPTLRCTGFSSCRT